MSDAGAADEWDFVVPDDDGELVAELRRHGVRPGQVLHVRSAVSGRYVAKNTSGRWSVRSGPAEGSGDADPEFFGSIRSGQGDLAERSQEILRAEFPGE
jgi:hypothetical protein